MKTFRILTLTLAIALSVRAEYAVFNTNTDSIALANGTTLGTTATIEAVFAPTSTTNGSLYFEEIDGQEAKILSASGTEVRGLGFASGSITTSLGASVAVAPRVFHHVAFVRDGAQERIYLDGALVGSRAVTNADIGDAPNVSFPAAIGAGRYFPQVLVEPGFVGVLDSIRVSGTARYTGASFTPPTGDMATDGDTLLLMNFDLADVTGNVVADVSGNGRNGTLSTTFPGATPPTIVATAPLNQRPTAGDVSPVPFSMFTDGTNDEARVPHHAVFDALESGDEVTFEGWMRIRSYDGATGWSLFDKFEATGSFGWHLLMDGASGPYFYATQTSLITTPGTIHQPALDEWTHIAVSMNQVTKEAVLYKNGEEVNRAILPGRLIDTAGEELFFGADPSGGTTEYNHGNLSEVRFWNRVLPGAEIKQRMFTQATGKENGLVSAWSMDEGSGTALGNRVTGAPAGTFQPATAAPTWSTNVPPVSRQRQHEATTMDNAVTFALRGVDLDGDALLGKIKSLPTNGALFQFDGTPITAPDTAVTDALTRVTFVPTSGFTGVDTLTFSMSDATLESTDALLSVDVTATAITRETWSGGDDFAALERQPYAGAADNPNPLVPQWSYGSRVGATGTGFTACLPGDHVESGGAPVSADFQGYTTPGSLFVNVGTAPLLFNFGVPLQPINPREIFMHPAASGAGAALPVLRWTAPYAGTFAIDSTWNDIDRATFGSSNGIIANVVHNGTVVFSQTVFNTVVTGFQVLTVNAGDVVDFVCGNNGDFSHDSTTLVAKITRVRNVYDAGKAVSRFTSNPNGVWRYGAKTGLDAPLSLFQLNDRGGDTTLWHYFPSSTNFGIPVVGGYGQSDFFLSPSSASPAPYTGLNFTTVRFTAPRAGRYRTFGFFSMGDVGSVDVHLRRGTEALFDAIITGTNSKANFDRVVDLSLGQTLDLIMGPNGSQNNDNTGERFFVMELPEPLPQPIVHYRFADGPAAGAVGAMLDSGPYLLHGTTAGTLSHSTDVAANPEAGGFSLDARGDSNYGQVNDTALLHQQGDFTVEMFFKADVPYDQFGSSGFSTMAVKLNTTAAGNFLGGFEVNSGHTGEVGGTVSFGGGTGVGVASTGLNTRDGQWHHVAVVMDRDVAGTTDELRLYVDGVLRGSTQGVWPDLFYGDQPLYIGAGNFTGPASAFRRNFDGFIDEFRLSASALSPAQFLSNLAPTAITLNDSEVYENVATGEVAGMLGGTDPNPGDTLTFSLVPGLGDTDNASFAIVGNELRTTAVFDYTTQPTYSVRIRATDAGGKLFEQAFTITVLDAPVLALPASPVIVEATGPTGAVVNFMVSATDTEDDPDPTATATPTSASTFLIGDTTVNVSATDLDGATTMGSFIVRVQDTTAPVVTPPANVTAEATSAAGAAVTYPAATASDAVGVASLVYSQNSGTVFPIGTTTVTATAMDAAGNTGMATFTVTVQDTTAPVVTPPANVTAEATSAAGAAVTYPAATASDAVGVASLVYSQNSGTVFPIGTTTVTATAMDAAGNTGMAIFTVTVQDTTAPVIAAPAGGFTPLTIIAAPGVGGTATLPDYTAQAVTSDALGVAGVTQSPAPGSTHAPGAVLVTLTAADAAGNTAPVSFTVTVLAANQPPTDIALAGASVPENEPAGTNAGVLTGTDANAGQTLSFALVAGDGDTGNGSFSIVNDAGTWRLKTAAGFDYETLASYSIRVRATDDGTPALSYDESFIVTVTDVTLPQTITFTPPANATTAQTLALMAAGGASGNPVTFSVVSGPGVLTGNSLTFSATGSVVVRASQAGATDYTAAADVNATIVVNVNTGLVCADDAVTITTGDATVYPLANDTDTDGDELTIASVSEPSVIIAGRTLIVPAGYAGTFTYTATDGASTDTANVVVTSGAAVVGAKKYTGLLRDGAGAIVGWVSVSHSAKNIATAQILLGSARGKAIVPLSVTAPASGGGASSLGNLALGLGIDGRMTATFTSGAETLTGSLRPAVLTATVQKHHIALASIDSAIPGGGFATVQVKTTGIVKARLLLPDGRSTTAGTVLSDNGAISFFAVQRKKSAPVAVVGGELILANLTATDVTGEIAWSKPAQLLPAGPHAGGVDTVLAANGCIYGGTIPLSGPATLTVSGDLFTTPQNVSLNVSAGVPTITAPITAWIPKGTTGTFKAKVRPANFGRLVTGVGLYLPKSNSAWGYFPGATLGGRIELTVP